jgi:predicted TIM-barrel fold metal-dependent hydrolase
MAKRFYNCHAHCFTYHQVPEFFLSKRLAVSWLLKQKKLAAFITKSTNTENFGLAIRVLLFALRRFGLNKELALRSLNFIRFGNVEHQEDVIKSMCTYYPNDTGFVLLTMDMAYMGAGKLNTSFKDQLIELAAVKNKDEWKNRIYPFIFCDPRRLQPTHKREVAVGADFTGQEFLDTAKQYLQNKIYQGIKIYPALGYYPFDLRMKPMYDFALENCIPIVTHCTIGAVHFKYRLEKAERYHDFLECELPDKKPFEFQQYLSHPLNFECLLNPAILKKVWADNTTDYTNLKVCIGHWGTRKDWHDYLDNQWRDAGKVKKNSAWTSLELDNWETNDADAYNNYSWFTIICDLMRKYPNVYADISFTLYDTTLLPLLKMILEADEKIRQRVLFGTDFYLVSKAGSERAFSINVRAALGHRMFEQIAITNAERFLSNKFNRVTGDGIQAKQFPPLPGAVVCE